MRKVVGIRFKSAGKIYDFESGAFVLNPGDTVIVETEQGLSLGTVIVAPMPMDEKNLDKPLKKVFRLANENDFQQKEKNVATEKRAQELCLKFIRELGLKMNLFAVENTFDASKLTFFFTSDGRVDFRQLVKMLVKEFRIRIEMRQVGIRNQAKMCGGLGRCGRQLCCATFMEKFEPVSIRMAKEQGLSLNPTKISGLCSRLMCCLTFEHDTYRKLKETLPKIGKTVNTKTGAGKVVRHNVLCNRFVMRLADGSEIETEPEKIIREK
jgi:cell fate regulator YaaT (PSP1 superfamily)